MRFDRGTNGGLRQSALWGKPSKGETRSSALWGKGGRGLLSLVVVALALTAPVGATASSRYAYTKSTAAIASVVKNELSRNTGQARGIKRQFSSVNGVAANLTGAQILRLVSKNGIAAIEICNRSMQETVS